MTYLELVRYIKELGLTQANTHSVVNIFTDLNREDATYSALVLQPREHLRTGDLMTYRFYLGYVDRLVSSKDNALEIESTGITIINNLVNILANNVNVAQVTTGQYIVFTQRFLAECAGVYAELGITLPVTDCSFPTALPTGDFNFDYNSDFKI